MKGIRNVASIVAAIVLTGCKNADETAQTQAAQTVPMPGTQHISIALISNYAFMGQMASKGDGRSFSGFYVDSATIARAGHAPLAGKAAIQDFIRNADEWGVREWTRISEGFRVEGREVIDSGTYALALYQPLPPNTLDAEGRYRTRWLFAPNGEWVILSDSLTGVTKK
jgi:hypothetical protein